MTHEPKHGGATFQCPHCNIHAQHRWFGRREAVRVVRGIVNSSYLEHRGSVADYIQKGISSFLERAALPDITNKLEVYIPDNFSISNCNACNGIAVWINKELVFPLKSKVEPPNKDLNDEIKKIYLEAEKILTLSPKGSAALLRLALQKLLIQLGKKGSDINSDIKELVSEGLNPKIQKALDLVRVVGNEAVHPGQIDFNDDSEIAEKIFSLINFIANELITKPNELDALYEVTIPTGKKEQIKKRDGR